MRSRLAAPGTVDAHGFGRARPPYQQAGRLGAADVAPVIRAQGSHRMTPEIGHELAARAPSVHGAEGRDARSGRRAEAAELNPRHSLLPAEAGETAPEHAVLGDVGDRGNLQRAIQSSGLEKGGARTVEPLDVRVTPRTQQAWPSRRLASLNAAVANGFDGASRSSSPSRSSRAGAARKAELTATTRSPGARAHPPGTWWAS